MLGLSSVRDDVPYFWSDQYDIKLQILGSFGDFDQVVHREDRGTELTSFFLRGDKIVAVIGVNRVHDVAVARRLMQRGVAINSKSLASENLRAYLQ